MVQTLYIWLLCTHLIHHVWYELFTMKNYLNHHFECTWSLLHCRIQRVVLFRLWKLNKIGYYESQLRLYSVRLSPVIFLFALTHLRILIHYHHISSWHWNFELPHATFRTWKSILQKFIIWMFFDTNSPYKTTRHIASYRIISHHIWQISISSFYFILKHAFILDYNLHHIVCVVYTNSSFFVFGRWMDGWMVEAICHA